MDEVDPAFFCPENVFFICYIHMKEKIGKNIQYLLTWYVYGYIVIPTPVSYTHLTLPTKLEV